MFNRAMLATEENSGFACFLDTNNAHLLYRWRANGSNGGRPTSSDYGATFTWHYRDPPKTYLTNTYKYWPDYDTSAFFNGDGIICDPSAGDYNFPLRRFAIAGSSWSHMMRIKIVSPADAAIKTMGLNSTDWTTGDLMYGIGSQYSTLSGNQNIYVQWNDGTGTSGGNWGVREIRSETIYPVGTPLEILATRDGPASTTYLFINGTLVGSFVGNPRSSTYSPDDMKVATGGSANTGANLYAGYASFYLNDEYVWDNCIATASYTPQTRAFC